MINRTEVADRNEIITDLIRTVDNFSYNPPFNTGKDVTAVGERQWPRKIASIKEATKNELWFVDSFNVDLMCLVIRSRYNQEEINVNYSSVTTTASQPQTRDHGHLDEVLYLLDAFNVSDEFYHELSMVIPSLPHSYLVKSRRQQITSNVPIFRLPKPLCYRSLEECIQEAIMRKVTIMYNPYIRNILTYTYIHVHTLHTSTCAYMYMHYIHS